MKNILFTAYNMQMGGIEKALIELLKKIDYTKYNVTLVLEKKEGLLLNQIPQKVNIIEYKLSQRRHKVLRKIENRLKITLFNIKNKNKFEFSCCYAPYSIPGSLIARNASKNNSIFIHTDYINLYNKNIEKVNTFFSLNKIKEFKRIIFVSKEAKESFETVYTKLKNKTTFCNNLIDNDGVIGLSNERIELEKNEVITFLNVSRHEEDSKRLKRLFEAAKKLKDENYLFRILMVGNGEDTTEYKNIVKNYNLDKEVLFLGEKSNPYPYFKISNYYIMCSEYEGFPVVYLESLVLSLPIITTIDLEILDTKISDKYGYIVDKNVDSIYAKMKQVISEKNDILIDFDVDNYNNKNFDKFMSFVEESSNEI